LPAAQLGVRPAFYQVDLTGTLISFVLAAGLLGTVILRMPFLNWLWLYPLPLPHPGGITRLKEP